jgi:hypothetical protein
MLPLHDAGFLPIPAHLHQICLTSEPRRNPGFLHTTGTHSRSIRTVPGLVSWWKRNSLSLQTNRDREGIGEGLFALVMIYRRD